MHSQHTARPIALITGASRGLGRNAALKLAAAGYDLVFTYQQQHQSAQQLIDELAALGAQAVALQYDSRQLADVAAFAAELQQQLKRTFADRPLDVLINNAGVGAYASVQQTSHDVLDEMLTIHVKAVWLLSQAVLPMLRDGAAILNISSGLARFSLPGYAAYAAAKGAVEVMTRYWALELGARRIRVNVLAPGAIETDFGGGVVRDNQALNQQIASQTALGRVGMPDDIGEVIAWLVSPQAGWINGQRIEASGGIHL
jgi:NAD(P)-dependent dehydrogenase (short-subunit alcohol dehydrogenase family)